MAVPDRRAEPRPVLPAYDRPNAFISAVPSGSWQATLAHAFVCSGHGLHTGRRVTVRVSPAPADHGVVFRRTLTDGRRGDVRALWRYRETQPLCTALRSEEGILVRTVEHVMASLSALRIDNALIELDAEELPIFDGSAAPWCAAIRKAGRVEQDNPLRVIRVLQPLMVEQGERSLQIKPGHGLTITGRIALAHFGRLVWSGRVTPESFCTEIAPARSFGRFRRAMLGRTYGFVARKPFLQGVSPTSAALLVRGRIIGGMRFRDEPVRHRILDVIGDFALAGYPVEGRITAVHTGHELNHALVAKLMRTEGAWELV